MKLITTFLTRFPLLDITNSIHFCEINEFLTGKRFGNATAENFIDSEKFLVQSLRTQNELYGVKVTGRCVSPRCIAYDKEVAFILGIGKFDINGILTNTRCQTCPYKDRNSQKPIQVKNISLVNCFWKVEGNYIDVNGFNNFKYCKDWFKTEGDIGLR